MALAAGGRMVPMDETWEELLDELISNADHISLRPRMYVGDFDVPFPANRLLELAIWVARVHPGWGEIRLRLNDDDSATVLFDRPSFLEPCRRSTDELFPLLHSLHLQEVRIEDCLPYYTRTGPRAVRSLIVAALSACSTLTLTHGESCWSQSYRGIEPVSEIEQHPSTHVWHELTFTPSLEIFPSAEFNIGALAAWHAQREAPREVIEIEDRRGSTVRRHFLH